VRDGQQLNFLERELRPRLAKLILVVSDTPGPPKEGCRPFLRLR